MKYFLLKSNKFIQNEIKEGINDIGISLNGGKDSIVVFDLFMRNLKKLQPNHNTIPCIFLKEKNLFPEILKIINYLKLKYNIEVVEFIQEKINPEFMKESLKLFIKKYKIKRIIIGTRQTDPYLGNLSLKEKTDNDWPEFVRLMPIYYWTYKNIWNYIDSYKLKYCKLYKQGFTYVGDKKDTIKNPFINNKHAREANDNIEIYSRKKYYDQINNKKLNSQNGIFLIKNNENLNNLIFENKEFNYLKNQINEIKKVKKLNIEEYFISKRKEFNTTNKLFFVLIIENQKIKIII